METSALQLTPEQRRALLAHPDEPLYIADQETRKVYVLLETGKFPELEEEYIRARLEEARVAIERGDEEEWDSASIKQYGRHVLERRSQSQ
jgi:hypothetical protein